MVHFRAESHHYLYGRFYRPLGICAFVADGTVFVENAVELPVDTFCSITFSRLLTSEVRPSLSDTDDGRYT